MGIAHSSCLLARNEVLLCTVGEPGELALEERHLYTCSLTRNAPPVQGSHNRHRRLQSAHHVRYRDTDLRRFTTREACDAHDPAACLHEEVVTRSLLVLPRTEARYRAVHQTRVNFLQTLVAEA